MHFFQNTDYSCVIFKILSKFNFFVRKPLCLKQISPSIRANIFNSLEEKLKETLL